MWDLIFIISIIVFFIISLVILMICRRLMES